MVNVAVIVLAVTSVTCVRSADDNHGCRTKDDSLTECFIKAGNEIFRKLHKGDPSIGLPVLDPLEVKKMIILNNGDQMRLDMKDATHRGLGDAVIQSAQVDPQHYKFIFNITIPKYSIKGYYDMNAKIVSLPMMGKGDADLVFEGMASMWDVQGKPVMRKGKLYMDITDFKVYFTPKGLKVNLDNMFNGNKELGKTMNNFLNENWEDVLAQLKPSMEKSFSQLMKVIGSKLLEKIPYKDMFPDV